MLQPLDVGVRAINGLLTVGQGQRIGIMAGSGVGKSVLLGMIVRAAEADVIVIGLIGERSREVADFLETKVAGAARQRAVVVAVPANHSPVLRIRGALRTHAIAEAFRAQGKKVLLIMDSLDARGACRTRDRPGAGRTRQRAGLSALGHRHAAQSDRTRRHRRRFGRVDHRHLYRAR